jgi:hypothetical protein
VDRSEALIIDTIDLTQMEREQHTVVLEGATLTMGEELFQPSERTKAIVGCCCDLYVQSLETFVFALVFSGKVGVYDGRTGIPGENPTPVAEGLTKGFEERLREFGKREDKTITVRDILAGSKENVRAYIDTLNRKDHSPWAEWQQHMVREVWMYSSKEASQRGIEQRETTLENSLESDGALETFLATEYVESMLTAVRANIGRYAPPDEVVAGFIRKNTVAHIAAHCAYDEAVSVRDDLGANRSLMPHPTRQTLVPDSIKSLIRFVVPSLLYKIVVVEGVREPDTLRAHLGDYTVNKSMIDIQRKLAGALAGSDEDRRRLLMELGDATTEVLAGNPFPPVDAGTRKLAIMRTVYLKDRYAYSEGLKAIFPTLREPPPAQFRTTNL